MPSETRQELMSPRANSGKVMQTRVGASRFDLLKCSESRIVDSFEKSRWKTCSFLD